MLRIIRFGFTLLCLFWFSALLGQTPQRNPDIRFWSTNHPLSFSDFKGLPAKRDTALSDISTQTARHRLGYISTSIHVHYDSKRGKAAFTIRAAMQKGASWIKHRGDTVSMQHEQGHFDICEIYARILRREIRKSKSLKEAKSMFANVTTAEELEHDAFDRENTYGLGGITHEWRIKIAARLKKLEAYSNPVVVVAISK
jgi:hypothetical protein